MISRLLSSSFCDASASGKSRRRGRSFGNVVLTMKKISRRKAISARDDEGMSLETLLFFLKPPSPIIVIPPGVVARYDLNQRTGAGLEHRSCTCMVLPDRS